MRQPPIQGVHGRRLVIVLEGAHPSGHHGRLDLSQCERAERLANRLMNTDTASGNAQARGAVADVDALIGAPVGASITLQHNDIIVTDQGVSYALWGPRTYGRPNVITGQPVKINGVSYFWLRGTAVVN